VSSVLAKRAFPLMSAYSAAKHGVDGFLEALRLELRHDGVPVAITQILPATVGTPFFEHSRTRLGVRPSGPPPVSLPERVAEAILSAAEKPRRDIAVGVAAKFQVGVQRLSPRLVDAGVQAFGFRSQHSSEPKGPEGPDALEAPVEGDDRRHGVVTTFHR
jgi:short-subunit dehydrogenase